MFISSFIVLASKAQDQGTVILQIDWKQTTRIRRTIQLVTSCRPNRVPYPRFDRCGFVKSPRNSEKYLPHVDAHVPCGSKHSVCFMYFLSDP